MIQPKVIKKGEGKTFEPLTQDTYQIQILDVEEIETNKYMSDEKITQFMFKTAVVDGEYEGRLLFVFTSQSWYDGSKQGTRPSKLFNLFKAVYAFYKKDVDLSKMQTITDKEINNLIDKQLRVSVDINKNNRNVVTGFMPIKKEIKYEQQKIDLEKINL